MNALKIVTNSHGLQVVNHTYDRYVYKIMPIIEWNNFIISKKEFSYGTKKDIESGFIHCSAFKQMPKTIDSITEKSCIRKHLVLCIDTEATHRIVWEPKCLNGIKVNDYLYDTCATNCKNNCEKWPHIYGTISPLTNIMSTMSLKLFKERYLNPKND